MARRATSTTSTGSRTISSTRPAATRSIPGCWAPPAARSPSTVQPNTEFNKLLMRTVSAVSEYEREQSALTHFDNAAARPPFPVDQGRVRAEGDPRLRRQRLAARLGRHCLHRRADGAADPARAEGPARCPRSRTPSASRRPGRWWSACRSASSASPSTPSCTARWRSRPRRSCGSSPTTTPSGR